MQTADFSIEIGLPLTLQTANQKKANLSNVEANQCHIHAIQSANFHYRISLNNCFSIDILKMSVVCSLQSAFYPMSAVCRLLQFLNTSQKRTYMYM